MSAEILTQHAKRLSFEQKFAYQWYNLYVHVFGVI